MQLKMFDIILRFRGEILHTLPKRVSRNELKLLAHIHGAGAIPADTIKFIGMQDFPDINSEMDEFKSLARRYNVSSDFEGADRGRKYVEACFNTKLEDFEAVLEEVDAVEAAEKAIAKAEKTTVMAEVAAAETAKVIETGEEKAPEPPPKGGGLAAGVSAMFQDRGRG